MADNVITVERLAKTYRRRFRTPVEALRGVSFEVARGEIFGLLGPNGAGKTTILKLLLGIAKPTAGAAIVLGESIGGVGYRRRIGYLPEGHQFPEYLTAAQILDFTGAMRGTSKADRAARIPGLLKQVGMDLHADKKVREFSKGMKQRTGLAAALINSPEIVFLDEPTDGVDPVGRRDIRTMIVDLCRKQNVTVILNSHMLSEVEMVADRVAILNQGEILKIGKVDDIIDAGEKASRLYHVTMTIPQGEKVSAPTVAAFGTDFKKTESGFDIRIATPVELNKMIDYLRGQKVVIQGIVPERATLEDVFMSLIGAIQSGSATGQGGGAAPAGALPAATEPKAPAAEAGKEANW
ncbi:MAG TPA: ABC transporter ATP-binding protein [Planctomycetota bacterium]|nr:ABC transporter ATP-binding protein [Planctomycetota bacterium]